MQLPQELIDKIVSYLPEHVGTYSLIAKSWVRPTQKRLFEVVVIHEDPGLRSWLETVSPTNVELLGHVRSLTYVMDPDPPATIKPLHDALRDYLPSFHQLRCLKLFAYTTLLPQQIETFSPFQHTLSHVTLSIGSVTIRALITLINYFPNLVSLCFSGNRCDKEDGPFPPLSRPLFKDLLVSECCADVPELFDDLSELGLRFDKIVIQQVVILPTWPEFAKRVADAFGANAKFLTLSPFPGEGMCNYMDPSTSSHNHFAALGHSITLSHCRKLCKLAISTSHPAEELNLISSITGHNSTRYCASWLIVQSTSFNWKWSSELPGICGVGRT